MNTIAVIGSRSFNDYPLLKSILDEEKPECIVSGGAAGADTLARQYSHENNISLKEFFPLYSKYGRKAPIIRNKDIVYASDRVIAFWDGLSTGTKFTIDFANSQGKSVRIVNF